MVFGNHPDAALLILSGELRVLQGEWHRLWEATPEAGAEGPADIAWRDYSENVWPGGCRLDADREHDPVRGLITMRATTLEGMRAKAAAIKAMDDAGGYLMSIRDDSYELMVSLLQDVASSAAMPPRRTCHPHCVGCGRIASNPAIRAGRSPAFENGLAGVSTPTASPDPSKRLHTMAKAKNVTTIPVPSRRRALLAAAGAVFIGTGVTSGVAASVADFAPSDTADVNLLLLCAKAEEEDRLLREADRRWRDLRCDLTGKQERAARDKSDAHFDAFVDFAEQASVIPALTVAGMRAKARIVFLNMDTQLKAGELTWHILRDLGWGA